MPRDRSLRGAAAIVGAAESDIGEVGPHRYALELVGQATVRALADAGLSKNDVDGLFGLVIPSLLHNVDIAEYLGIRPRYSGGSHLGGASFETYLHHAALAIAGGACEVALVAFGSTIRSAAERGRGRTGLQRGGVTEEFSYEKPFNPVSPVSYYALAAARHMHQYGTTREQLAEVAVAARRWAALNPRAFHRSPLTIADVCGSRMVSTPLTVRDCCLVTDAGAAVIVTSAERARDLRRPPVYLLGAGEAHWHRQISQMPDLTVTAAAESGERAFAMAGLRPSDVDVVQLYDAFTINTILFLEDLGYCAKGEGGAFVAGGAIAPGGELAVNTNGGGLSYTHPGAYGMFLLTESVRQLRGEAGAAQQAGAQVALAHGNGGTLSSQATVILGTRQTL